MGQLAPLLAPNAYQVILGIVAALGDSGAAERTTGHHYFSGFLRFCLYLLNFLRPYLFQKKLEPSS